MATWVQVKRGKLHWRTSVGANYAYPETACGRYLDRERFASVVVDGCPEGDAAAGVCKRCYAAWHR